MGEEASEARTSAASLEGLLESDPEGAADVVEVGAEGADGGALRGELMLLKRFRIVRDSGLGCSVPDEEGEREKRKKKEKKINDRALKAHRFQYEHARNFESTVKSERFGY